MADSIAAKEVAKDVIATVRAGKRPNLQEIQQRHGYTPSSAKAMKATRTDTYQREMKLFLNGLERERNRALAAISRKDLDQEDVRVLKELIESFTKVSNLIQGKATENVATSVTVVSYKDA